MKASALDSGQPASGVGMAGWAAWGATTECSTTMEVPGARKAGARAGTCRSDGARNRRWQHGVLYQLFSCWMGECSKAGIVNQCGAAAERQPLLTPSEMPSPAGNNAKTTQLQHKQRADNCIACNAKRLAQVTTRH